jgi:hypothetical protein
VEDRLRSGVPEDVASLLHIETPAPGIWRIAHVECGAVIESVVEAFFHPERYQQIQRALRPPERRRWELNVR